MSSLVLTVSFLIFHATNFFYHFYAARKLGPEDYAVVASLFSLIYIFSVGSNVIQTSITKFSASFIAKKNLGTIKALRRRALRRIGFYSFGLFVLYLLIGVFIAQFLRIEYFPVFITGILILFMFVISVNRGIMQGMQKFNSLGANLIFEGVIKLVLLGVLFYFGFKVIGAISAVILAAILAFVFSFTKIKAKPKEFSSKGMYSYSYPVLLALLSITAMYSIDVFLAKHIFPAFEAGLYSAVSLLGKIVFFGATAISMVMFSKVSELHEQKKDPTGIKNKALILAGLAGAIVTIVYFLFPNLILKIIFGSEYLGVSGLLGWFGVFMLFLSLSYILVLYKLSINKKRFVYILGLFNLVQILGLYVLEASLYTWVYFLAVFSFLLFIILYLMGR